MDSQHLLEEVAKKFRESLSIPKIKNKKQIFFCPVGLVGAGKTTVTKPISEKLNLLRISSDEGRKMLKEAGLPYSHIKEIGFTLVQDLAKQGYSIALDMDCGNPLTKEFIEKLAKELNARTIFVHVTAPEEFILNKFRNHPPTWLADNPQIMIDNYLSQKEVRQKENTHFDFLYTFDTSRSDLQKQIEECVGKIENTQ